MLLMFNWVQNMFKRVFFLYKNLITAVEQYFIDEKKGNK